MWKIGCPNDPRPRPTSVIEISIYIGLDVFFQLLPAITLQGSLLCPLKELSTYIGDPKTTKLVFIIIILCIGAFWSPAPNDCQFVRAKIRNQITSHKANYGHYEFQIKKILYLGQYVSQQSMPGIRCKNSLFHMNH